MVPSSWAGSKGVISVVQDAADGLLYQVFPSFKFLLFPGLPLSSHLLSFCSLLKYGKGANQAKNSAQQ